MLPLRPNPTELVNHVRQIISNFEITEKDLTENSFYKTVTEKAVKEIAKNGRSQG